MEIKAIKNEGKELILEFDSKDMTFPDLVAHELLNDSDVSFAGASISHPEMGLPILVIRTTKKNASAALESALKRIEENAAELREDFAKKKV